MHAHSTCATAVSSHQKNIPAFHYMIGVAGGEDLKCTKYATFGTRDLSKNILKNIFANVEQKLKMIGAANKAKFVSLLELGGIRSS